jgi:AbrB family looped-hinge helix DNA binding protein
MKILTNKFVLTKKSQITLPKQVRDFLGVNTGEQIIFIIEDNSVKIMPVKSKLEQNFLMQTYSLDTLQRMMKRKLMMFWNY